MIAGIFPSFDLPLASTFAANVDRLYDSIFWFSVVAFVIICAGLVGFSHRYARRRRGEETPYIEGNAKAEIAVASVLTVVVLAMFWWGYVLYMDMRTVPANALEINVTGRQWTWDIQYKNGRRLTNTMTVPLGQPVKLLMTSDDVLHSFYVPDFRVKNDVVPGMYTSLWFEATQLGTFQVLCAEYCGTGHSSMLGEIHVVEPTAYREWQEAWQLDQAYQMITAAEAEADAGAGATEASAAAPAVNSLAAQGATIFQETGCAACHSVDGVRGVGPNLNGIFGKVETLQDGTQVTVDENYVRESIVDPTVKVLQGFVPAMPTYKGQLSAEQLTALIEYLKAL